MLGLTPSQQALYQQISSHEGKITKEQLKQSVIMPDSSFRGRLAELKKLGLIDYDKSHVWLISETLEDSSENNKILTETEHIINSELFNKYFEEGVVELKGLDDTEGLKITIVLSDLHMGDENLMIDTYKSAINNLITKIKSLADEHEIGWITVILNGDTVAGRWIFRGQEAQNIFNKGNMQIFYAAAYLYNLNEQLSEFAPVQWFVIKGNHDQHRGDNYAWNLADKLRALGLDAFYSGHQLILNLGNTEKEHWALIEHGYGGSDYYPVSYDFIRNTIKKMVSENINQFEKGRRQIERVIVGHTHWLITNLRQDLHWAIDVTGGFQRNDRVELGKNQRPAGFLMYVFNSKKDGLTIYDWKRGLRLFEIPPDEEIAFKEIHDPALELKNREDVAKVLRDFYWVLVDKGLVKTEYEREEVS